ncbi:MAG: aldose 1-epimerase family protein [Novosphingobium sp.]|nr:aldose 1-epimerase family protein [Novosphingobium sp.]
MSELIAISSGELSARINPLGAELWSLTDADHREYMTDADPRFWTGHAPVLFPIVGMLNGGRYRLGHSEYALPKHGFARTSRFTVVQAAPSEARFLLSDSAATRQAYPFAFGLEIRFRVAGMALQVEAAVTNPGDAPLPFSFGFHPAFAWPLPGGAAKEAHEVIFDRPEPEPIRRIDPASALLLREPQRTPVDGRVLRPRAELFEADALIWDRLSSRSVRFGAEGGSWLDIAFPDCPYLGIWQKPGAPFLAIEPWHGLNDPEGFTGDFHDKPGVIMLPRGDSRRFRMDVTVRPG